VQELGREVIELTLEELGFVNVSKNQQVNEYQKEDVIIYVKKISKTNVLTNFSDVITNYPIEYYHNSNIVKFETRVHKGKGKTHYGFDFGFSNITGLKQFISLLTNDPVLALTADIVEINSSLIASTVKKRLCSCRIGQGQFRDELMIDFDNQCAVTGITNGMLLKASHVKPWSVCDNDSRLDRNNGLLLAAGIDALFDKGFITFHDDGKILISKKLTELESKVSVLILRCEFR
jgi:HNH endonuclease